MDHAYCFVPHLILSASTQLQPSHRCMDQSQSCCMFRPHQIGLPDQGVLVPGAETAAPPVVGAPASSPLADLVQAVVESAVDAPKTAVIIAQRAKAAFAKTLACVTDSNDSSPDGMRLLQQADYDKRILRCVRRYTALPPYQYIMFSTWHLSLFYMNSCLSLRLQRVQPGSM